LLEYMLRKVRVVKERRRDVEALHLLEDGQLQKELVILPHLRDQLRPTRVYMSGLARP